MVFFVTGKIARETSKGDSGDQKEFAIRFEKAKTVFTELGEKVYPQKLGAKT